IFPNIDVSRTVGWFTSIYPISLTVPNNSLESNIKNIKEQLKKIPNNGFNFGIYKYIRKELESKTDKLISLNYLGNFDYYIKESNFELMSINSGEDSSYKNKSPFLIDVRAMIINGELLIEMVYSEKEFKKETI